MEKQDIRDDRMRGSRYRVMEINDDEMVLIEILRNFDFLRNYNYTISKLNLYGREHYIVYDSLLSMYRYLVTI